MKPNQNQHLIEAYIDYMNALDMCRRGIIGNANFQREHLRTTYRIITGKELS
jgi:hypothetical protein